MSEKSYHYSQLSPAGWYIASYLQRIDPIEAYDQAEAGHEPWAVWENRILVRASNPDEALKRTRERLEDAETEYLNTDGVLLRDTVVGLTGLIPIYDELEDGNEIEWLDHTGETISEMEKRVVNESELEAFTVQNSAKSR